MQQDRDQYYRQMKAQALQRVKQLENDPNWEKTTSDPCEAFKMELGDRIISKGVAIAPYAMNKIFEWMDSDGAPSKMNQKLLEWKSLHYNQHDEVRISYARYKGIWPASDRDFVRLGTNEVTPNKIYIIVKHIDFPYPEVEGVVRGILHLGANILEAVGPNQTKITYISDVDVCGSIPGFIKNKVAAGEGEQVAKTVEVLKKYL